MVVLMRTFLFYLTKIKQAFNIHKTDRQPGIFLKRFIAQKLCTSCTRTSYKIVPLTNRNKYVHTTLVKRK